MTILLCDVGGTHIRFAVSETSGNMTQPEKLLVRAHESLEDAIQKYLLSQSLSAEQISRFYLSFGSRNSWLHTDDVLQAALPKARITQMSDFAANALGIITAHPEDLEPLKAGGTCQSDSPSRVVLGVGTGLGLAYIYESEVGPQVQRTFGGHMLPAAANREQQELFAALAARRKDGTISIYEDILSGQGLFNLYVLLCQRSQLNPQYHDISDLIVSGHDDPVFTQALAIFFEVLGVFTHEAVAFGSSYNGVYLTGGIIDKLVAARLFNVAAMLKGFHQNNVPVVTQDVIATPVYWVRDEFISLRGLLLQARKDHKG